MRKLLPAFVGAAALFGASAAVQAADATGVWLRPSTGATLEFYNCADKLCAKVAGVKDQTKKDAVGKVIVTGATKSGDKAWKGDLLNLDDGKTYSGVFTLESDNALNLKGCVLGGIICKSETMTRQK